MKALNWLALTLLLLLFERLLLTAAVKSATFDEILHIQQGALYWQHGPLRSVVQNPPLVNAVIGLPVTLLFRPELPTAHPTWVTNDWLRISQAFFWEVNQNGLQLLWAGRFAIICLATMFGALVYRWGCRQFRSNLAGFTAMFLFTFDPNILAHSHLATTDLGAAFFLFLAAYLVWNYWRSPKDRVVHYLLAGVGVGCVLASKFSGLIIVPAIIVIAVYRALTTNERPTWLQAAEVAGWLLIGALLFLAIYRFDLAALGADFAFQQEHQRSGHSAFLLGELRQEGWWYYFPVVFAAKTPVTVLALLLFALALWLLRRRYDWQRFWLLLLAGGVAGASLVSRVNLGYRYLLPALPLLYLFVGQLAQRDYVTSRLVRGLVGASLLLTAVASLVIHPDYLAYFNELAGGPGNGWRIAVDSNLDWGQDIQALRQYMAEEEIESVNISWLGTAPLEVYGVRATPIPAWPIAREEPLYDRFYPDRPAPGVYVLSATQLHGVYLTDPARFRWFQARPPDGRVGYSLFVYDVKVNGPLTAVALSGIGVSSIAPADYDHAFGSNNVWPRWYDARNSLLWPGGGSVQSWAAVGDGHLPTHAALQTFYPAAAKALRGHGPDGLSYQLYHWPASPIAARLSEAAAAGTLYNEFGWSLEPVVGSADWAQKRQPLVGPAIFDDHFRLLGYEVVGSSEAKSGQGLEILSYWRAVNSDPETAADLAVFVHVLNSAGLVVAQHDGLDVRSNGLQTGDEFAQLHTIPLPPDLAPGRYALQIGLYDRNTMARLPLPMGSRAIDRLLLHSFDVR